MNSIQQIKLTENEFKAVSVIYKDCLSEMGGKNLDDLLDDQYTWTGVGILQDAGWSKHEAAGTISALCEKGILSDDAETAIDATPAEVLRSNHILCVCDLQVQILLRKLDAEEVVFISPLPDTTPKPHTVNDEIMRQINASGPIHLSHLIWCVCDQVQDGTAVGTFGELDLLTGAGTLVRDFDEDVKEYVYDTPESAPWL